MKKTFLSLVCLFLVIALISCSGGPAKQLSDQEILVKIYEAMNGPEWQGTEGDNWLSDKPVGEWEGVKTNDEGRVIALRIAGDNVRGLFPAEMGGLTELEQLFISSRDCDVPNVIPAEIGELTKLKSLSITVHTRKQDKPVLPDLSTLVNLEKLYLKGFGGAIPENIAQLSKLQILGLHGFEGKIPESICELTDLIELSITMPNQPEGGVPDCIGSLGKLTFLNIDFSIGIAGGKKEPIAKFPESIWDLSNLENLSMTSLSSSGGPIPGDKVAKMSNLKSLTINKCGINGTIPAEIFASVNLNNLSLNHNKLKGSIPAEIGNCPKLNTLRLSNNQLTGKIPAELAKCEKLNICDLSGNQLSPDIPAALKAHPKFSNFKF